MYQLRNTCLKQMNIAYESTHKPSIDLCIHWLDPLLPKCQKLLYQDAWASSKRSLRPAQDAWASSKQSNAERPTR